VTMDLRTKSGVMLIEGLFRHQCLLGPTSVYAASGIVNGFVRVPFLPRSAPAAAGVFAHRDAFRTDHETPDVSSRVASRRREESRRCRDESLRHNKTGN